MNHKKPSSKSAAGNTLAIGAGIAALAAASYYFLGPKGKQHRKQVKGWSIKMKGEVVERIEKLKDVSEPVYNNLVDAVAAKYAKDYGSSKKEVVALAEELKKTWRSIVASTKASARKGTAHVKKAVRNSPSKKVGKKK